ncbi:MAG TPA: SDR family oxidoreductase [Candidatus Baltobacteraceae bacterium]|nr:SDR family oxidoreductase [Candidatus Baltobacteraceae bacterium]
MTEPDSSLSTPPDAADSGPVAEKSALITGATSGIGSEFAEIMAADGYALALVARDQPRLAARARELESQFRVPVTVLAFDLSDPMAPAEIFDELQRESFPISVLVNNAAFGVFGRFAETGLDAEMRLLEVNMGAVVQLTKLFLSPMLQRREGRILNVASTASFQPGPWLSLYSASKAFVYSFSCALALELEGTGVSVTALCPGGTQTEFQQRAGMEQKEGLFRPMSARRVAEIGYRAMLKGRPIVVAGWKNWLMVEMSRRCPTMWTARVAAMLNRNR